MHQQVNRLVEATLALLALACMRDCPREDPGETTDNSDGRVQQQIMAISMSVKTLQKVKVALTKSMKEIGDEALVAAGAVTGLQETVAAMEAQGEVDLKNAIAEREDGSLHQAPSPKQRLPPSSTVPVHDELSMAPALYVPSPFVYQSLTSSFAVRAADVRLKDAVTNMVTLYSCLHVFSGAADLNLDLNVHWSRETKSEILLRQVLQVLTSLPEDCTTCTIACSGDVGIYKYIFTSIEEFIVAFETPGYYGGKWGHTERYSQLEW